MTHTIFITGGATGIGRASVEKFISEGWNVAFMDVNVAEAQKLVEHLNVGKRLLFIEGNVSKKQDIEQAFEAASAHFGSINSIFANAGIHRRNTILDISDDELDLMINTNIYGCVNTLRVGVPYLEKAGGGSIVINASDQFFVGKAKSFGYGLTKGAVGQIARSLSVDLGPLGIRVNAICAGTIHTPLVDNLFANISAFGNCSVEELMAGENALYPRGKMGQPEEVAELVYFLASDKSSFCNGGHYLVDGGLVATR